VKSNIETVFLTNADMKRAKKFAKERCQNIGLYQKRGGFKEIDIISGAMAEIAVYKLLKEREVPVGKPDFTIHSNGRKSYDADLSDGLHNFHVKGQTIQSKQKYGASWIMQRKDPIVNSPQKLHYLVPCVVDTSTGRVEIFGIMSILSLKQHACFSECKLEWFRKTKIALYLDHIEGIMTKKARWGFFQKFQERLDRE
jgi:hypothetical protein